MSTFEYDDLYIKCQNTGIYHMFIVDIVESKKMTSFYRKEAKYKMIKLMNNIYKTNTKNRIIKILTYMEEK